MKTRVLVSAGYGQFYLGGLAERLWRANMLDAYFVMAYPKRFASVLRQFERVGPVRRLIERAVDLPNDLVRTDSRSEVSLQLAQRAWARGDTAATNRLYAKAYDSYAARSARSILGRDASIYHFRAGLGGESISAARHAGMRTICDLSVAHPATLPQLIGTTDEMALGPAQMWRRVEFDVANADILLVNSEFVKSTCIEAGVDPAKIRVAYTSIEPSTVEAIIGTNVPKRFESITALFAGSAEPRKGIDTVVEAARMPSMADVPWTVIGQWSPALASLRASVPTNVSLEGHVSRFALSQKIASAEVFVFPSRAEGSARVVAEALAAGCYVITTANAGSILRDGVDGRLVVPGDADAIRQAIEEYMKESVLDRRARSLATAEYARERLSADNYFGAVTQVYEEVASAEPALHLGHNP